MAGITNNRYYVPIDLLPDAFAYHRIITDDQGKSVDYVFLDVNPAFEKMTGLKKENVIGKAVTEVLPSIKSSQYDWINAYGRVALGEESLHFEQYSEPLGRWYKVTAYSDNSGYFGTIFQDVTEKKETEKSLIESEEKHHCLFETMVQGVIYQASDGIIITANPAAERILGLTLDQMQGKTSMDLSWQMIKEDCTPVPGSDHPAMIALRTGQKVGPVTRGIFHPLKKSHIWLNITATPLFQSGEKEPFQVYATLEDITEQRKAEKSMEEEFKLRTALLDNIPNCIALILKKDTREIVASNRAGQEIGAVPGKTCFQTCALRDDPCPFCLAPEVWKKGQLQHTVAKNHGTWYEGIWAPLSDDLYVHYIFDITERKLAEEELEKLNRELEQRVRSRTSELEQVNKELNAFTYSVSHDLRSPLRRINGFSQMVLEEYADQLDYQGKDYLKRIATSAVGMNELIEDLLKLSRVSRHELEWEPVELSVLVRIYLEQLIEKEPGRKVEVVIAPGIVACGDTALLRIAIGNLLDNAWKYTAECEEARIEFGSLDQEGCQVYYISDNGAGFDMKHAGKLFTPFQRLHSTSSYSGTGIGLSIVSRIITRHGGEIWGEGELGKGATFFFTLPYA